MKKIILLSAISLFALCTLPGCLVVDDPYYDGGPGPGPIGHGPDHRPPGPSHGPDHRPGGPSHGPDGRGPGGHRPNSGPEHRPHGGRR